MKKQYITDDQGKKMSVILPFKEYKKIMEDLNELHCIKIYNKVKDRKTTFIPAAEIFKAVEKKRKHI